MQYSTSIFVSIAATLVVAAGCTDSNGPSPDFGEPAEAGGPPAVSTDAGGGSQPDAAIPPDSGGKLDSASVKDTSVVETSSGTDASASEAGSDDAALPGWTLTWSDEFDDPDGSEVNQAKWTYDTGPVYNNELETYTDGTANSVIQGGVLVITAKSDNGQYTSARINTAGKFSQKYGRFEARIQLPTGQGMWPAFWLLGDDMGSVGWPACGEIDIMENVGDPTVVYGSLHATNYDQSGGSPPGSANYATSFHVYAVEWAPGAIEFSVDGNVYASDTPDQGLFNQSSYIILNVAVGGNWPGSPDGTTMFPQTMKVDWVRVYSKSEQ